MMSKPTSPEAMNSNMPPEPMIPKAAQLYVLDDHERLRTILVDYLGNSPGLNVIGHSGLPSQALLELKTLTPDLILVDMSMPEMSGADFVKQLLSEQPDARCIILTAHVRPSYELQAREAGARGFVYKDDPSSVLRAIQDVLTGKAYFS